MATTQAAETHKTLTEFAGDCPECGGRVDASGDEEFCRRCGLVTAESRIDHGPEWRSFAEEETDPRRAAPGNRNHPDRGLGSEVGFESRHDGRLDKWNKRTKAGSHKARNRGYATQEIHRMGHALELPASVTERGKWLFRQAHDAEETDGRDLDAVAAGCLYAAAREETQGRTPDDVARVARAESRPIRRRAWDVIRVLGLEVPPPSVPQRVRVVGARLSCPSDAVARAVTRADGLDDGTVNGMSPSVLAAALLYEEADATQATVGGAAGVTPASVRNGLGRIS